MTFEQIQAMQNMGFTKEDIMEVIRSSGETTPAPTPEPKPEPKPEEKTTPPTPDPTGDSFNTLPSPQPSPKAEDDPKENKDHELITSLIKQVETLTGAIQQSNIVNAQMGDVKTNQQIVDDMLADIVNPTYKKKL